MLGQFSHFRGWRFRITNSSQSVLSLNRFETEARDNFGTPRTHMGPLSIDCQNSHLVLLSSSSSPLSFFRPLSHPLSNSFSYRTSLQVQLCRKEKILQPICERNGRGINRFDVSSIHFFISPWSRPLKYCDPTIGGYSRRRQRQNMYEKKRGKKTLIFTDSRLVFSFGCRLDYRGEDVDRVTLFPPYFFSFFFLNLWNIPRKPCEMKMCGRSSYKLFHSDRSKIYFMLQINSIFDCPLNRV